MTKKDGVNISLGIHGVGVRNIKKYLDTLVKNTCIYQYELDTAIMLLNSNMYGHLSDKYMNILKRKTVMKNPSEL